MSTHTDEDAPAATCAATATPTPVIEYVAPAPPINYATPVPVIKHVAPASAASYTAPSPVTEYVAPALAVTCGTPAPETVHVTRSLVIECIAPGPAVTFSTPSQLLPPAYIMESVTTGVSLDTTGLVNLHCLITAAAPHIDGSLPPLDVSAAPVYNQVRQEQIRSKSRLWKVSRRSAGGSAFRNALWSRLSMLLCVSATQAPTS